MGFPSSSRGPSDRALVASMRDPASDALVVLLRRHADALHDYISATVADPAAAEDIFMKVFVRAWSQLTVRRMPAESALPWMLAAARDAAAEIDIGRGPSPASNPEDAERALTGRSGALLAALEGLTSREHRIVELCLVEGRSYRQAVRHTRSSDRSMLPALLRPRSRSRGAVATLRGSANG
ncbi:RNA polymerase sigma factor [Microbacterium sp. NPDC058345]|uniref:RNA polymerase sigma factor n=1 Tax=Microbacterium sp. NPDC058345 TaxID=3346455 RepID=UPI00365DDA9C